MELHYLMSTNESDINMEVNLGAEENSKYRQLTGFPKKIQTFIGIFVPLFGVAYILNIPYYFTKITFFTQQFLGVLLALILAYLYLILPASPRMAKNPKVPWYDWILILASLCGGFYIALFYPTLLMSTGIVTYKSWLFGGAMLISVIEATRRLTGWALVIIIAVFALYGRFGYLMPGFLATKEITWGRLINQVYFGSDFIFGTALLTAGAIVFAFVLFGQFLFGTGGAKFLLDLAQASMGKYRGGPAKISVVASGLMGTLSGSAVGNVAAVGIVTIPLMTRTGYAPYFAAAVEAVSSTGGIIMPPVMGASAFIMAQLLGIPFFQVVLVALVPAVLYYLALFLQVDLRAAKRGLRGIPKAELPSVKATLLYGWIYILPIVVLIYSLFASRLPAQICAIYSVLSLLIVASIRPSTRKFWRNIPSMLEDTTKGLLHVIVICGAAGMVIGVMSYTGLGISFSQILVKASGGSLLLLAILTAIASSILGMGMPIIACYLFLATVAAPAMVSMGVQPILAHLFVFYYGAYSFLTPPVCLAVYAASSIAKSPVMKTSWQAMKLAIAGYVIPFIFIYKPSMVFMGTPMAIVLAIIDAIIAVFCLAIAVEGYFRIGLVWWVRVLYLVTAGLFFVPGWSSRILGLVLFISLISFNYLKGRLVNKKNILTPMG